MTITIFSFQNTIASHKTGTNSVNTMLTDLFFIIIIIKYPINIILYETKSKPLIYMFSGLVLESSDLLVDRSGDCGQGFSDGKGLLWFS